MRLPRVHSGVRSRTVRAAVGLLPVLACLGCASGSRTPGASDPSAPGSTGPVIGADTSVASRVAIGRDTSRVVEVRRGRMPATVLMRSDWLASMLRGIHSRDPRVRGAYEMLLRDAKRALATPPHAVTHKGRRPPSGDPHDFMSLAPYWWPDTTKPDGLPFIRRDGVVNPETRRDHDGLRLQATIDAALTLALANYLSGEPRYAEGAARRLRVFFLDDSTRMNPHLRFAQAIPGVTEGRGLGIIDTRHMPELVDALRLLEGAPGWSAADAAGMRAWCRAYLDWLLTSEHGRAEQAEENNHGTWYDVQVAALALFVGDSAAAREAIDVRARQRLAEHVAADGRQPLELARTRPLHYSLFNLDAFTALAEMGRHVGVDLWREGGADGTRLAAAVRHVARYADPAVERPPAEVTPVPPSMFLVPLRRAAAALGDTGIARAVHALPPVLRRTDRSTLFHPDPLGDATPAIAIADPLGEPLAREALRVAAERLLTAARTLDPANGWPRVTDSIGRWIQRPAREWTSGFFPGALWYLHQQVGDSGSRVLAERWTAGLEELKHVTTTHDLGFMIFDSFGHGYLLTGTPHYRDVVIEASRSLATRFDSTVGAIKSWDTEQVSDRRRTWKYPVIVDNLMNLEMLFWAARHGGDPAWARMAERHALTSVRAHIRPDGSTAHVALFDPATGALERTVTWQGWSDTSVWARGQAWAIHGLATSYGNTGNPELLRAARSVADWFIANLPSDGVPYWDFRHPDIPRTERDASAAAIAASGLYDLARYVPADVAARYRLAAGHMLRALATDYLGEPGRSASVLQHAVGQRPQGVEIDVGLIYADYYFVEALLRRRGTFLE